MSKNEYAYSVEIPMPGNPGAYMSIVRALEPEGAADCVRALLSQKDKQLTEIVVRIVVNLER